MSAGDIYSKSQLGQEEVSSRKIKLSSRVRTMLILVDGHVPVFVLKEEAEKVGAEPDFIEQLEAKGLIVKTGTVTAKGPQIQQEEQYSAESNDEFSRFRLAQDFMNASVVNSLGIKSFFFTLKLERAANLTELRELLEPYKASIAKGSGQAEADVLSQRLLKILG